MYIPTKTFKVGDTSPKPYGMKYVKSINNMQIFYYADEESIFVVDPEFTILKIFNKGEEDKAKDYASKITDYLKQRRYLVTQKVVIETKLILEARTKKQAIRKAKQLDFAEDGLGSTHEIDYSAEMYREYPED